MLVFRVWLARWLSVTFAMLLLSGVAHAQLSITEKAVFYDATNQLSLEAVEQQNFKPYQGIFSGGYKQGTYWIRLRIRDQGSPLADAPAWILTVQPTYLDEIELFDPLIKGGHRRTGQRFNWLSDESQGLAYGYRVPVAAQSRTLWLRVKTQTTYMVDVRLDDEQHAAGQNAREDVVLHTLTAALMLLFVFASAYWLIERNGLLGAFAIKQFMAWVYGFTLLGYHRLYLSDFISPEWLADGTKWAILLYAWVSVDFHQRFFEPYKPRSLYRQGMRLIWWVAALSCALGLAQQVSAGLVLNKLVAIGLPIWLLLMIYRGIDWSAKAHSDAALGRRTLLIVHWLMLVFLLIAAIPTLGFPASEVLWLYSSMVHGALTGAILLVMVHRQFTLANQNALRLAIEAQKDLDMEREHRERQSQFMSMLTHELRTPLSVLKLAFPVSPNSGPTATQTRALRAIDDMNGLIERCNQLDRIEQHQSLAKIRTINLNDVLRDIQRRCPPKISLEISAPTQLRVQCDTDFLHTIVSNLVDNAIKYARKNSVISVRAVEPSERADSKARTVALEVRNEVTPETTPVPSLMFNKFYRARYAQNISGSGLGLYIVQALAQLMHARVYAAIEAGPTVLVRLELPSADSGHK